MIKYSIIIPTWNNCERLLMPCISSLRKYTDLTDVEVLVVSNGSTDETKRYITAVNISWPAIKLIWVDERVGYPKAINIGLAVAQGRFVVLLNNDTVLLEQQKSDWLKIMEQPFLEDESVGITGPMKVMSESAGREFLIFFCVMISRKVIDKIGFLDESFKDGYGEDSAYCIEAEIAGFKVLQVPRESKLYYAEKRMTGEFPIFHAGNESFRDWPGGEKLIADNNAILRERYNKPESKVLDLVYNLDPMYNPETGLIGWHGVSGDTTQIEINIERAKLCDGFMSDREMIFLAELASKSLLFAEVGVWHGKSSRAIADNLPENSKLICVDTWNGSKAEQDTWHLSAKWADGDHAFIEFTENLYDLMILGKVIPLRMSSKNAADLFKKLNVKFDTVFIDAGHTYEEAKEDIEFWIPLVKDGGTLCGHDYYEENDPNAYWPGVRLAVNEKFGSRGKTMDGVEGNSIWAHEIKKEWWIDKVEKKIREEVSSWGRIFESDSVNNFIIRNSIFDCFIFNNETDLLERRLETLFDIVDRFIIVEGKLTHSGKQKELVFHNNLQRFEKYLSKITYLVIEENEFPVLGEGATVTDKSWAIERYQRDAIMRGLKDCKDNDIVIISDCDEIPNPEKIKEFKEEDGIKSFSMDLFYYDEKTLSFQKWNEAKICTYKILKEKSPCGVRYTNAPLIEDGGKHLSYQGGIEKIIQKISDTAHCEYSTDYFKNPDRIKKVIEEGSDLFDRPNIKFERL